MKIRAGKKLWRRNPMHAPATAAERIAASILPSERARVANVRPAIAQTPDASPSSPSRKLTMFITATIQMTVSGMPTHGREVDDAEEREREVVDPDAERARDRSGRDLAGELRDRVEAAEVVDRADDAGDRGAEHDPRISPSSERNASEGTRMPRKIARPPSRGIGRLWMWRPPGR